MTDDRNMQAIPVGFSGLGNLAGASFETGIGLGGSLAGACLVDPSFTNPRARLLASIIGGAVSFNAKSLYRLFQNPGKLGGEMVCNFIELGAGIGFSFLPSLRMMFLASAGASILVEYLRQKILWNRNEEAIGSALLAGAFSTLFGMLFFIPRFRIPHRSVPDEARREAVLPAERWFLRRHDSLLGELRRETAALKRDFELFSSTRNPDVFSRLTKQADRFQETFHGGVRHRDAMIDALKTRLDERKIALIRLRHVETLNHEAGNEAMIIVGNIDYLGWNARRWGEIEAEIPGVLTEIRDAFKYLENVIRLQTRRPGLQGVLESSREFLKVKRMMEWGSLDSLRLSRSEGFDAGLICRRLVELVSPMDHKTRPIAEILGVESGLEITLRAVKAGPPQQMVESLLKARGWTLSWEEILEGQRFHLRFPRS